MDHPHRVIDTREEESSELSRRFDGSGAVVGAVRSVYVGIEVPFVEEHLGLDRRLETGDRARTRHGVGRWRPRAGRSRTPEGLSAGCGGGRMRAVRNRRGRGMQSWHGCMELIGEAPRRARGCRDDCWGREGTGRNAHVLWFLIRELARRLGLRGSVPACRGCDSLGGYRGVQRGKVPSSQIGTRIGLIGPNARTLPPSHWTRVGTASPCRLRRPSGGGHGAIRWARDEAPRRPRRPDDRFGRWRRRPADIHVPEHRERSLPVPLGSLHLALVALHHHRVSVRWPRVVRLRGISSTSSPNGASRRTAIEGLRSGRSG